MVAADRIGANPTTRVLCYCEKKLNLNCHSLLKLKKISTQGRKGPENFDIGDIGAIYCEYRTREELYVSRACKQHLVSVTDQIQMEGATTALSESK